MHVQGWSTLANIMITLCLHLASRQHGMLVMLLCSIPGLVPRKSLMTRACEITYIYIYIAKCSIVCSKLLHVAR